MSGKPLIQRTLRADSSLERLTLNSAETVNSLKLLYKITSSCRGPHGKIKMLQNTSGGHLTLTSLSKRLFNGLSLSNPVNKLIITAAQGHLDAYGDCGLFIVNLSSLLVLKSVDSNLSLKLLSEVYEFLLNDCINYLNSAECLCKMKISLSSLDHMNMYVRSILESKTLCALKNGCLDFIGKLVLESFLLNIPDVSAISLRQDNVSILCVEGFHASESSCYKGLLLQAPDLSNYRQTKLNVPTMETDGHRTIRVAVITVSMSGDLEEVLKVKHEIEAGVDFEANVLETLSKFCQKLMDENVGLVICQKVIHPRLKRELRCHGVVVLDRLGLQPLPLLLEITGCTPIQSVSGDVPTQYYGFLDKVEHQVLYEKSYLLLSKPENRVTTLVLCHLQEEVLQEMKEVCSACLISLRHLLYEQYALTGAGCWQTCLASHVKHKISESKRRITAELEISESFLLSATDIFTYCLQHAAIGHHHGNNAVVKEIANHLFVDSYDSNTAEQYESKGSRCCNVLHSDVTDCTDSVDMVCGDISGNQSERLSPLTQKMKEVMGTRKVILDGFTANLNALKTAIITAATVLRIGQIITDDF